LQVEDLIFVSKKILLGILSFEIGLIASLLFLIFSYRFVYRAVKIFHLNIQKIFLDTFILASNEKRDFNSKEIQFFKRFKKQFVIQMIDFIEKRKEQSKELFSYGIDELILFPFAKKLSQSFLWKYRYYAAKIFELFPNPKNEKQALKLLDDSSFEVSQTAVLFFFKTNSYLGIKSILKLIEKEVPYSAFYYGSFFQKLDVSIIQKLINEYKENKKSISLFSLLKVLKIKKWEVDLKFLIDEMDSSDKMIQINIIEVFRLYSSQDAIKVFFHYLSAPDIKVQKESIFSLATFVDKEVLKRLKLLLKSKNEEIRLAAIFSLSQTHEGMKILESESIEGLNLIKQYQMNFLKND
jgi:hypothetical protein